MQFDINPSLATPIYRQIVDQVRRMVAGGLLKPGDELPSVRSLAQQHAINPMTVSKAYSMLEMEGLVTRQRGLGMTIAAQQPKMPLAERLELLRPSLQAAARHARELEITEQDAMDLFQHELKGGKS